MEGGEGGHDSVKSGGRATDTQPSSPGEMSHVCFTNTTVLYNNYMCSQFIGKSQNMK